VFLIQGGEHRSLAMGQALRLRSGYDAPGLCASARGTRWTASAAATCRSAARSRTSSGSSLLSERGDTVADFSAADDTIQVACAVVFNKYAAGAAVALTQGTAASGGAAQFVYDGATGNLLWDADGSGASAAVTLATLANKPAITAADVAVIA
jgi:hypothetical protein